MGLIYDIGVATALEVRGNGNIPGEPTGGASCYGPVSNFIKDSRSGPKLPPLRNTTWTVHRV